MRLYGLILTIAIAAVPGAALATDARLEASLHDLDSATRLIQVCDLAVMDKMSGKEGVADRAFIDALHRPEIHGDVAKGDGGAFRRKGEWFEFSYRCAVTPDHMQTTALDVHVKRHVPHSEWAKKNFYP